MWHRILYLFLAAFLSLPLSGQQLTWSSSQRMRGNNYYSKTVGQNTNGIYVIRAKSNFIKRKFAIERYSNSLALEYSRKVKLNSERYVTSRVFNDKFYIYTSDENPETNKLELKLTEYSKTLEPTGKSVVVDVAELKNPFDKGDFKLSISPDGSKMVVYHNEVTTSGNVKACIKVLDTETFDVIGFRNFELQYSENYFGASQVKVANNGAAFFVGNAKVQAERKRDDYFMHYLFCFNPYKDDFKDFLLGNEGSYTTGVKTTIDIEHNRLVAVALISKEYNNTSKGIEVISIDAETFELVFNNFIDYSSKLKSSVLGEYRASKNEPLANFTLSTVVVRSDGGVVVLAEKFYITTQTQTYITSTGVPTTTTRSVYNFDDIIIMSTNPDGTVAWEQVINKSQSSVNDGGYYSSFVLGLLDDEIKIIFNDRLRGNGDVLQYTITANGEMTNRILLRSDEYYVAVMPSESRQLTKNTILVSTSKNKRFSLLKLDYRY